MSDEPRAPRRLLQTDGPAGDCVREALAQRDLLQAPPGFAELQERRSQRARRQRGLSLLAAVAVVGVGARALQHEEPLPNIRAEVSVATSSRSPAPAVPSPDELTHRAASLPPASKTSVSAPAVMKSATPRDNEATTRSSPAPSLDSVAKPASDEPETVGTAKGCAQLARAGSAEEARACYEKLSSGSGMTAEIALFEQARLEGKVLRRPERALLTLEAYRRRFPNGSLRPEVMLAQIDWLLAAGDRDRARQIVDEALASGLLRERAAELQRLRATLTSAQ